MTKLQTALASLVAVIPAAILAVLLVLGFLNHFEQISGALPLLIVAILALLCCVAVVLTPVIVYAGGGGGAAATPAASKTAGGKAKQDRPNLDDEESDFETDDGFENEDEMLATGEFETVDSDEEFGEGDGGSDAEMLATGEFETFDAEDDFGDDEWEDDEK